MYDLKLRSLKVLKMMGEIILCCAVHTQLCVLQSSSQVSASVCHCLGLMCLLFPAVPVLHIHPDHFGPELGSAACAFPFTSTGLSWTMLELIFGYCAIRLCHIKIRLFFSCFRGMIDIVFHSCFLNLALSGNISLIVNLYSSIYHTVHCCTERKLCSRIYLIQGGCCHSVTSVL